MYDTRAGTLSMMSRSSPSDARSASCACFNPWMSFISTKAPTTSPDDDASGTTRIVIQRRTPFAPGTSRSNAVDSPCNARVSIACRTFVGHCFAAQRAGHKFRRRERCFGAAHFLDRPPDDIVAKESREIQERFVDEHVAPLGVEIHDRLGNVVGEHAKLFF